MKATDKWTSPVLWGLLTQHGAPKPPRIAPWWNDWAANNPTGQAKALAKVNISGNLMPLMKAIATGARPVNW